MNRVLTFKNTVNAVKKAKKLKPKVDVISFGIYQVTNRQSGHRYQVRLWKEGTDKMASCGCQGFQVGVCFHVLAACGIHIVLAESRTNVIQISEWKKAA